MRFMSVVEGILDTLEEDAKAFWKAIQPSLEELESEAGQILLAAAKQMVPIVEQALLGAAGANKFAAASQLVLAMMEAQGKKAGVDFTKSTMNTAIEIAVDGLQKATAQE